MKDKLLETLNYIKTLAEYGDIRIKDIITETIKIENGKITNLSTARSRGVGIRVYINGAMGFAATSDINKLLDTAKLAYDTALVSNTSKLCPKEAQSGKYVTPIAIDPFTVPIDEKIVLLMSADAEMAKVKGVTGQESFMIFKKEDVIFADTDGSYITQQLFQSGGRIKARAGNQWRSYGNHMRAGYEAISNLKLTECAKLIAKEAVALSKAENCPAGIFDVILMPNQLQLQIHESVGHPTELDRVLGSEAAFAGASFLSPDDIGLKYGSEHMTIEADFAGYDDEGVPAQRITLIDKGIFKNFQTSRDNAKKKSFGMGLADGWGNLPIVRMTNINLQPGQSTLDELISGIEHGLLLEENKSWSIDDRRINFQFACEIAREIKNGKLTGKIYKNPTYTGITKQFWGSCDGVEKGEHRQEVGVPNCGKGQPMQIMYVLHASQPARFRKVRFISCG